MQIIINKKDEKMAKKRKNSNYVGSRSYYARENAKREKEALAVRHKMTVLVSFILALVLVIAIPIAAVSGVNAYKTSLLGTGHASETLMTRDISKRDVKFAEISIEKYGKFVVLLDATAAPETVANFIKLANEGFYNGLTFHRANSTIIQGGDPNADGTGGSKDNIKGEFSSNGVTTNNISHLKGVISMARSSASKTDENGKVIKAYDSASSQFFICVSDYTGWNGQYAAFGYVVEGMSVVEAVNKAMREELGSGVETIAKKSKQPVIHSVRILDDYTFTYKK